MSFSRQPLSLLPARWLKAHLRSCPWDCLLLTFLWLSCLTYSPPSALHIHFPFEPSWGNTPLASFTPHSQHLSHSHGTWARGLQKSGVILYSSPLFVTSGQNVSSILPSEIFLSLAPVLISMVSAWTWYFCLTTTLLNVVLMLTQAPISSVLLFTQKPERPS